MLGTSDLDFGARLARRMDIDSVHLHSIHIGEVEPAEMLTELTMGEDTAVAIADAYGGHVLAAMSAIEQLKWEKHDFRMANASVPGRVCVDGWYYPGELFRKVCGKLFLPACQYTRATIMLRLFS